MEAVALALEYRVLAVTWCVLVPALLWMTYPWRPRLDPAYVVIFLVALLLRYTLTTWGPGDLSMNLDSVFNAEAPFSTYGNAPAPLLRLAIWLAPGSDRTVMVVSMILGALAPVALAVFAQQAGCTRVTALASAAFLAATPLMVRFSGEGNRQAYLMFLSVVALGALARSASTNSRRVAARIVYMTAALLCLRCRPEAMLFLPMAFFYSLVQRDRSLATWSIHAATALVALLFFFRPLLFGMGNPLAASSLGFPSSIVELIELGVIFDRDYTPLALMALFGFGILAQDKSAAETRVMHWALATLGVLLLAYALIAQSADGLRLSSARYQTFSLVPFLMVAAIGCGRVWERLRSRSLPIRLMQAGALAALVVISWQWPMRAVTAKCTVDREYAFVRETIPMLPPDAVIFYVAAVDESGMNVDTGLRPPIFLSSALGLPTQRWVAWWPGRESEATIAHPQADDGAPRFYYHSANCWALPNFGARDDVRAMLALCRVALAAHGAKPFRMDALPVHPFAHDLYNPDPVPVGFYRLE